MELIKNKTNIDFLGQRYIWFTVSFILMAISIYLWVQTGEDKYGVDFRGGTEIIVRFNEEVPASDVRNAFAAGGYSEGVIVQAFEGAKTDFSVRLPRDHSSQQEKEKLQGILKGIRPSGFTMLKEDFVGPIIGSQIRRDAILAVFLSLTAMLIYIGVRFEWRYGLGGILAIFHDCIIVIGFCLFTHREMSAGILAAVLTITGYSINDTVIVYDRIRENIAKAVKGVGKKNKDGSPVSTRLVDIMNQSVNETLSRTILTSMTAFFVCLTLCLFGGGAVSDLAFTLMVGIVFGTYSSVFIACPIVLALHPRDAKASAPL